MADRAVVRNAADPQQVARGKRVEERKAAAFTIALERVLGTAEGRFVLWELIARAGVYRSIWENSARIHYNAGRQDYGHELLADIIATSGEQYEVMEREARVRQRRENHETDAAHTPAAVGTETDATN